MGAVNPVRVSIGQDCLQDSPDKAVQALREAGIPVTHTFKLGEWARITTGRFTCHKNDSDNSITFVWYP